MAYASTGFIPSNNNGSQTFSLIWLDANVNTDQGNIEAQRKLSQIINYFWTFDDPYQCHQYILRFSPEDRIVLIVSGHLGSQIVPHIHGLRQISAIYVYCQNKQAHEHWARNYIKVTGFDHSFCIQSSFYSGTRRSDSTRWFDSSN